MEKVIRAFDVSSQFDKILQYVLTNKDSFVVERDGEPVAAVVSMEVYEQWKKATNAFLDKMPDAAEQANLSPKDAEDLAEEAIQEVRSTTIP